MNQDLRVQIIKEKMPKGAGEVMMDEAAGMDLAILIVLSPFYALWRLYRRYVLGERNRYRVKVIAVFEDPFKDEEVLHEESLESLREAKRRRTQLVKQIREGERTFP
ncbi:MAG TPA: hypothetical protein VE439_02400 [Anaerolineae bacterium]|nr:hypothetical protein [Anaerolineae bacterium]